MNNINERLKYLRKNILKISQEEFAEKLNVTRSNIGNIETGRIALTERNIITICNEFNINEQWLKNGIGNIFKDNSQSLENQLKNMGFDEFGSNIAKSYLSLNDYEKKAVQKFISSILQKKDVIYNSINSNNSNTVKIVARGEGITEISQEEFDRITKNAVKLDPKDYHKYF